jgi:PAS domain S-box-containing protein
MGMRRRLCIPYVKPTARTPDCASTEHGAAWCGFCIIRIHFMHSPYRPAASWFTLGCALVVGTASTARAAEWWTAEALLSEWPGMALAGGLAAAASYLLLSGRYRKRAADFAVSAERLQFLFDHAPVAVVVTDMRAQAEWIEERRRAGTGDLAEHLRRHPEAVREQFEKLTIVAVNRTALQLGGLRNLDEARAGLGRFAPDFAAAFAAELEALWAGRFDLVHNVDLHRPDGQVVRAIMHWSVPSENGRPDYSRVMSVFTDVTDLRRTQEKLRQSEDRWELAVQGINAGIWEIDFVTGRFFVSERSREMLGYAPGDLEDSRAGWEALIHQEDRTATMRAMELHLEGKTAGYNVEHRLLCKDGRYRWVRSRGLAQFEAKGAPVRFVGTHSDIHARKVAEEDLAAERERLRVTLRAMVEAVLTTDRHGVVNYLNEAAEQLTGWKESAAIGRALTDVCPLMHERTNEPVPPPHRRALSEALVVELPPSTALRHRQGVARLVEGRCAPIRDIASQPAGVVLVLRDVTERAKLEAERLRATKLESVGVLAGGIAHDFNNLLTVIMGNVTLASLDTQVQSSSRQWLVEAEKGLLRARDLTQQLLTFAKGGDPVRSAVQLAEVVRETAEFCLHGAKAKCQFEFEPDLWAADVDKGQIGQVVQNLVLNASQAMPQGGMIWVSLANDSAAPLRTGLTGPTVRLSVADTGAGIRPEHVGRIFDPYFTTKREGSGLGLATVYAIVKKHGGYIEVESELGRGTRFHIWLPATKSAAASTLTHTPFGGAASMNGRVLLMDDEEGIRTMAAQLLRRIGFSVAAVADGEAAVNAYREALGEGRRFDLVIMDLTVPGGMGGLECMRELMQFDPQVRAIVSSGYSSDPVMSDHRSYGFAGMIPKPYRITDFAKVIRQVLEGLG